MEKLKEEIRTTFASADEINIASLTKLDYINGVMDESFRLYPPAAGNHPRMTPSEGARILGEWLPGNVSRLLDRVGGLETDSLATRHPWVFSSMPASARRRTSPNLRSSPPNDGTTTIQSTRMTNVKLSNHSALDLVTVSVGSESSIDLNLRRSWFLT